MTLKDFIRLLKRRWLSAALSACFLFFTFVAVATVAERPQYRARTKLTIDTPPVLLTASQSSQWIAVSITEPKTWISLVSGKKVRQLAAEKHPEIPAAWFDSAAAVLESDQILWMEAVAPTPEDAARVVSALGKAAEEFSLLRAREELDKAIAKAREREAKERGNLQREEAGAKAALDEARVRFGVENLEGDFKKLQEDILGHETRGRDLDRRFATNRLRLERVRNDRSVSEHLQREGAPRLLTASAETRLYDNPRVKGLVERLENLHRDLMLALRKYTAEHPQVKALRADLRESEVELTRARAAALGAEIDREELSLRSDNELIAIEHRVLDPELAALRGRADDLRPFKDREAEHRRRAGEANVRIAALESARIQLDTSPLQGVGYLKAEDETSSARIEMRLRRSWPVALLAAVIFGASIAFLLDMTDGTLRTDYDVRRHLDWPTLAVVPKVPRAEVHALAPGRPSLVAETYDMLSTVLLSGSPERAVKVFLVTGTNPAEGKTAASINLAAALSRQGRRTLLVDGDLRAPAIHVELGLVNEAGFADLLSGRALLDQPGLIQDVPELPGMKVLASGITPENPYELLDPARIAPAAAAMREQFDVVVIDTPPVLVAGDALKLASAADAGVFVIEAGRTDVRQATWAKRLLQSVNAKIAGALLNRAASESQEYYPYYYTPRRTAHTAK